MEFVARKTDLLRELSLLQGLTAPNPHLPILSHVFLEADKAGSVRFAATDLAVGMRTACVATVTQPGVLAVPAKAFMDIVKSFPDTDVRVVADKKGATVTAEHFNGHMITLPAADFPSLPDPTTTTTTTIDRAGMRELTAKVTFAMSSDDQRYFLNGGLLVLTPERLQLVATDGHRLAMASRPRPEPEDPEAQNAQEIRALLSRKTLTELQRLLAQDQAEGATFSYAATAEHLFFHVGDRLLISRLVDAQFPAYERVIPKETPIALEFNRDSLATAVRRVAILADGRTRAVKLTFTKGQCAITGASPDRGEAVEPLPVDYTPPKKTKGEKGEKSLSICFNAQYLLEGLMACGTDAVTLALKDESSQVVLTPIGAKGYDYTYVLMPMRV